MIRPFGFVFALGLLSSTVFARDIPALTSPVIDEANLLHADERADLEQYIRDQQALLQMEVWIITSLGSDSLEDLSYKAVSKWKLGAVKNNNGALLMIAVQDKRMRFEIGRGLEGDIPDVLAGRILDQILRPNFRNGNFYAGIRGALEEAATLARGGDEGAKLKNELNAAPEQPAKSDSIPVMYIVIFIAFIILRFFMGLFSPRRGLFGGGGFWGGGGGGSWGGGGGWSGGGGSFGGGGASGSW